MRRDCFRFGALALGTAMMLAGPIAAQSPDPFESAPGPTPVAPKPVAHPHPTRPVHRAEPERDPADAAPSRAPAQSTIPAAMAVPPPAPMPPAARFDGVWIGQWQCEATLRRQAFTAPVALEIRNGQISRLIPSPNPPGAPGYDKWEGSVGPDGRASIRRDFVGTGVIPGSALPGEQVSARLNGMFFNESFAARVEWSGPRDCRLQLRRRH